MNTGELFMVSQKTINNYCFCSSLLNRHVVLPKEMVKLVPKTHLMSEQEWRSIGVQQSKGWMHYMTHSPGKCGVSLTTLIFNVCSFYRTPYTTF